MSFPFGDFHVYSIVLHMEAQSDRAGPQARGVEGSPGGVLGGSTVPARGNP